MASIEELGAGAEQVVEGRLEEKSRKDYMRRERHLVRYCNEVEERDVAVPESDAPPSREFWSSVAGEEVQRFLEYSSHKRVWGPFSALKDPPQWNSFDHICGYVSAFKNAYRRLELDVPRDVKMKMESFLDGYKKKVQAKKLSGEMPLHEGRRPASFGLFRRMAEKAYSATADTNQSAFGAIFLVLSWNLMARCVSTASLMFMHMSWDGDCMKVTFPKHKGDQKGDRAEPKAVYANPLDPLVCPILALALFVFSMGTRTQPEKASLFGKPDAAEKRFSEWLAKLVQDMESELESYGIKKEDVGTHSLRKGLITYLCGIPGGPSIVSICKRAGWSLGVKDRYIFLAGGDDEVCGRAACGLDHNSTKFAVLPPHFKNISELVTDENWDEILPPYRAYLPFSFRGITPFLLASLVHHRQWIKDYLPANHPIKTSPVWTTGIVDRLAPHVEGGVLHNANTGLIAKGVGPKFGKRACKRRKMD